MIRRLLQPDRTLLDDPSPRRLALTTALTAGCLAAYGFSTGFWRSPEMGCYVALKMPLLVAATLGCNAILNGLLGLLLGGLGFRESLLALLSSFASAALILGSLAPVTFLMALQAPEPDSAQAGSAHSAYLIFHVLLIALAGVTATLSLHRLLLDRCQNPAVARTTLLAWLAGNGFLGAQFSWILRPFFGSPRLEVAFLREDPLRGNFYEAVWAALDHLSQGRPVLAALLLALLLGGIALPVIRTLLPQSKTSPPP